MDSPLEEAGFEQILCGFEIAFSAANGGSTLRYPRFRERDQGFESGFLQRESGTNRAAARQLG
jgi:hypothetical protein